MLQGHFWDVLGAVERGLAALAPAGARYGTYLGSLGCPRRGARKELQTRK